jgi:predicted SAM-dependent methyltransferase
MTINEYLSTHAITKLQLGCGGNFPEGWLNTDIALYSPNAVHLDITKPFPIIDEVFDYVYSEHAIEHITYWQGQSMLQESFRVLKPGGRIRISCPNFQFLIDMYTNPTELSEEYIKETNPEWAPFPSAIFTFNNYVRDWGHQFIYDKQALQMSLEAAGFTDVTEHKITESTDPHLQNLEIPWRMKPGHLQLETMTLEAVKPA